MKKSFSIAVIIALMASNASAHSGAHITNNFMEGFAHPFNGTDHILMMLGVGLLGALYNKKLAILAPIGFVSGMLIGMLMASKGIKMPFNEHLIALSVIICGVLIAAKMKPPIYSSMIFAMLSGVFHGHAHGAETANLVNNYVIGVLVASLILHIIGWGVGTLKLGRNKISPIYGVLMGVLGALMLAS